MSNVHFCRDKETNEKDMLGCGESPTEEMWGRGEAMAIEEELFANFTTIDQSPGITNNL